MTDYKDLVARLRSDWVNDGDIDEAADALESLSLERDSISQRCEQLQAELQRTEELSAVRFNKAVEWQKERDALRVELRKSNHRIEHADDVIRDLRAKCERLNEHLNRLASPVSDLDRENEILRAKCERYEKALRQAREGLEAAGQFGTLLNMDEALAGLPR